MHSRSLWRSRDYRAIAVHHEPMNITMKTNLIQLTFALAAFTLVSKLQAQYTLDRVAIGGGGGTINGGSYALDGTAGQSAAGNLTGASYSFEAGFWAGAISLPTLAITRDR